MTKLLKKDTVIVISSRRFLAMLLAFLVLALAIGYAIDKTGRQAADGRRDLKSTTYDVLIQGCHSGNDLRTVLQGIILNKQSLALQRQLVKEGKFTQAELDQALRIARQNAKEVAPRDCSGAYAPLRP